MNLGLLSSKPAIIVRINQDKTLLRQTLNVSLAPLGKIRTSAWNVAKCQLSLLLATGILRLFFKFNQTCHLPLSFGSFKLFGPVIHATKHIYCLFDRRRFSGSGHCAKKNGNNQTILSKRRKHDHLMKLTPSTALINQVENFPFAFRFVIIISIID